MLSHLALLRCVVLAVVLAVVSLSPATATIASRSRPAAELAAFRQLNPEGSQILSFDVSRSDKRVLFLAAPSATQPYELYSVSATGGTPIKLNAPLEIGASISTLFVSPVGGRVVYLARQQGDSAEKLYSVPTGGGTPVPLADPQSLGGEVDGSTLKWTPDGSQVVFRVRVNQFGGNPLYRVAATGGTPQKIDDNVASFQVAKNSTRVVYKTFSSFSEVKSALLDGSATPEILGSTEENLSFELSPDDARVVFVQISPMGGQEALVAVPIAGGMQTVLDNLSNPAGTIRGFVASLDSSRVLYTLDTGFSSGPGSTSVLLRSVPITGGASINLGQAGPGSFVSIVIVPAPGGRVLFQSSVSNTTPGEGTRELFSVPDTGGTPVLLKSLGSASIGPEVVFNADGTRVALNTTAGVHVGSTLAGTLTQLTTQTASSGPLRLDDALFIFAAGGQLRLASFDGTRDEPLSTPAGNTSIFALLLDNTVVYRGSGETLNLYATDIDNLPLKTYLPMLRRPAP